MQKENGERFLVSDLVDLAKSAKAEETGLTAAQQEFIELEKQKAIHKEFFDRLRAATLAVVEENGTNCFFQDSDGTVYKTETCIGKFVHFEPFEIKRTRRLGETKGSLSMTEAKDAGFTLPDTKPVK